MVPECGEHGETMAILQPVRTIIVGSGEVRSSVTLAIDDCQL